MILDSARPTDMARTLLSLFGWNGSNCTGVEVLGAVFFGMWLTWTKQKEKMKKAFSDARVAKASLAAQNEELKQQKLELERECSDVKFAKTCLEAQNEELKQQKLKLEKQCSDFKSTQANLEAQHEELIQLKQQKLKLETECWDVKLAKASLEAQHEELKQQKLKLEKECSNVMSAKASIEAQHEELIQLRQQKLKLETQYWDVKSTKAKLEARHEELKQQNSKLATKCSDVQSANATLEAHHEELKQQNLKLETECCNVTWAKESLEAQHEELKQQNLKLETECSDVKSAKASLEAQHEELKQQKVQLETECSDLRSAKASLVPLFQGKDGGTGEFPSSSKPGGDFPWQGWSSGFSSPRERRETWQVNSPDRAAGATDSSVVPQCEVNDKWLPKGTSWDDVEQKKGESKWQKEYSDAQSSQAFLEGQHEEKNLEKAAPQAPVEEFDVSKLDVPSHWERHVDLQTIYSPVKLRTVDINGFSETEVNGLYSESAFDNINGHPVWWKSNGAFYIYAVKCMDGKEVMCIEQINDNYKQNVKGQSATAYAISGTLDLLEPNAGWKEFVDNKFKACEIAVSLAKERQFSFMDVTVEIFDEAIHKSFTDLLRASVVHHLRNHSSLLPCERFANRFQVRRILRVENWNLWSKYRKHIQQMKAEFEKYGITVRPVEPFLFPAEASLIIPDVLKTCGADESINECFLFHGARFATAIEIARQGFEFRPSGGYYGSGTYFASQACKSDEQTRVEGRLHSMIVARVALGDIHYAEETLRNDGKRSKLPPRHDGTLRNYDSVVAAPGPMPGHPSGMQSHQEFVIFDKAQAYPEFIVQYTR